MTGKIDRIVRLSNYSIGPEPNSPYDIPQSYSPILCCPTNTLAHHQTSPPIHLHWLDGARAL